MKRIHIGKVAEHKGDEVVVAGFVHAIRVQSKIVFINLRDVSGIIQIVVTADNSEFDTAKNLSLESVIKVAGKAKESAQAPGGVEIEPVSKIEVLSSAARKLPVHKMATTASHGKAVRYKAPMPLADACATG